MINKERDLSNMDSYGTGIQNKSDIDNFDTIFGLILPLHFFSNFEKTESAAETEICCDIIDRVKE